VARLEWLVHRAHYAADGATFDASRLAAIPESRIGEAVLALHPACATTESKWPLARLFEVHQRDFEGEWSVDFDVAPSAVLVYRPRWRALVTSIDAAEHAFLRACLDGFPIEQALSRALAIDPGFALDAKLARWVGMRVIVDFAIPGDDRAAST